jgi:hypothetical protein
MEPRVSWSFNGTSPNPARVEVLVNHQSICTAYHGMVLHPCNLYIHPFVLVTLVIHDQSLYHQQVPALEVSSLTLPIKSTRCSTTTSVVTLTTGFEPSHSLSDDAVSGTIILVTDVDQAMHWVELSP